jgi:hypothetical protein
VTRRPVCFFGTLDELPLGKKLCALLGAHKDPTGRCHYLYGSEHRRKAAALDRVPEVARPRMSRHIELAFDILAALAEQIHDGLDERLHEDTARARATTFGFHQNLGFVAARNLLALGFDMVPFTTALADAAAPRPPEPARARRLRDPGIRAHVVDGKPLAPGVALPRPEVLARLLPGTIEAWGKMEERIFDLWCDAADPQDVLVLPAAKDVGTDRFSLLAARLAARDRGARASLIRHAAANNRWPSTGVWVAEQMFGDAGGLLQEIGDAARPVQPTATLERILLPYLGLGNIAGLRAPLSAAAEDPALVPDELLDRLCEHAPEDFEAIRDERAAAERRIKGKARASGSSRHRSSGSSPS